MKEAEIGLPYWKQGDDLNLYLDECDGNVCEALELHAQSMDAAAIALRQIKDIVQGEDVSVWACTHSIEIEADDAVIDRLVSLGLADIREAFDDECDGDDSPMDDVDASSEWIKDGF